MTKSKPIQQKTDVLEYGSNKKLAAYLYGMICLVVALLPFHGFFTTWAGSLFGSLLLWRAWKELFVLVSLVVTVILLVRDHALREWIFTKNRPLVILIAAFAILQFVAVLFGGQNTSATVLGLVIQLRLFVIFALAAIAAYYVHTSQLRFNKLILIPAGLVVAFGLLQMFVLPYDFLQHFGYVKNVSISPFFTIDEQLDQIRIASTLRGPNPLGVYLILPITLLISQLTFFIKKTKKQELNSSRGQILASCFLLLASLMVLFGSHSRGAWLGLGAAMGVWLVLSLPKKATGVLIAGSLALLVVASVGVYQYSHTDFVQDVVLHDNPEEGGAVSSNQGHLDSLQAGVDNIAESPIIGCGPGCAGPASFHSEGGARLSENYFIQTAEESGVVGLFLLTAILGYVAHLLYQKKNDPFARVLLATFIGISVASLTAHAWADDTIAYIWWAIAGLYLYNKSVGTGQSRTNTKTT
ncbi:MAG TPA: O-antigen ligase family protein [Candidatus Saccharibacteria bacterium]|mgnify:CR=1 FL=1|nr:O-antigen ligase family protein [Candidatus Saccharibacteria bacterium]